MTRPTVGMRMVSELICLAILQFVRGHSNSCMMPEDHKGRRGGRPVQDAATDSDIYRHLLSHYALAEIDAAIRWLELGQYIDRLAIIPPFWRELTDKGREAADRSSIPEDEKKILCQKQ